MDEHLERTPHRGRRDVDEPALEPAEYRSIAPREEGGGAATPGSTPGAEKLVVHVSESDEDDTWDAFAASIPGSGYTQSSCWARSRAHMGWSPLRVVVSQGATPVGGVQVETKRMRGVGDVGFVHGGPIVAAGRTDALETAIDAMLSAGQAAGLRYLAVRPPRRSVNVPLALSERGFAPGILDHLFLYFQYAAVLDLSPGVDALMAGMNKKRRQNVRFAAKRGVTVRRGGQEDLPAFCRLKDLHAERLGYERRDDGYFSRLWEALAPGGHIELFVAEYEGRPVCAQLAIPFGDTSHHVDRPWSGEHGELSAPELVEWEAIRWAVSSGLSQVDLGGLETPVGRSVLTGVDDPRATDGASLFKLRWGGTVIEEPPFLDFVYNTVARGVYRRVPAALMRSAWMERVAKRLKESGS